jgi:hypothetical protein
MDYDLLELDMDRRDLEGFQNRYHHFRSVLASPQPCHRRVAFGTQKALAQLAPRLATPSLLSPAAAAVLLGQTKIDQMTAMEEEQVEKVEEELEELEQEEEEQKEEDKEEEK